MSVRSIRIGCRSFSMGVPFGVLLGASFVLSPAHGAERVLTVNSCVQPDTALRTTDVGSSRAPADPAQRNGACSRATAILASQNGAGPRDVDRPDWLDGAAGVRGPTCRRRITHYGTRADSLLHVPGIPGTRRATDPSAGSRLVFTTACHPRMKRGAGPKP